MLALFDDANIPENKIELAEKTTALIFNLKLITSEHSLTKTLFKSAFSNDSAILKLERDCEKTMRKSQEIMKTILNNYNNLATEINQKIQGRTIAFGRGAENPLQLKNDLNQLKFLNTFLGVKWDKAQGVGIQPIPLCGTGESSSAALAPESLHPKDCKSLGSLYKLMKTLRETQVIIKEEGRTIEIPGKGSIDIRDIEQKLQELYARQLKKILI